MSFLARLVEREGKEARSRRERAAAGAIVAGAGAAGTAHQV
jgi:hypothetical protein